MRLTIVFTLLASCACPPPRSPASAPPAPAANPNAAPNANPDANPNRGPRCIRDQGCPNARPLERCLPPGGSVLSIADATARGQDLDGSEVTIVSSLHHTVAGCTRMACGAENVCCKRCSANLVLSDCPDAVPFAGGRDVIYIDGEHCLGDDSGVCCGVEVSGQRVQARGILRAHFAGGNTTLRLEKTILCAPDR